VIYKVKMIRVAPAPVKEEPEPAVPAVVPARPVDLACANCEIVPNGLNDARPIDIPTEEEPVSE
jgi:hypothetical protein